MKIGIINDIHIDAKRVGGTTESSREALQKYALDEFRKLLIAAKEMDKLIILGDLFNQPKVDNWIFLQTLVLLKEFLNSTPDCQLILVRGNHDARSKDRNNLCSLELLAKLLDDQIVFIFDGAYTFVTPEGIRHQIVPHMFDQNSFDKALTDVPEEVDFLYLHVNVDNPFCSGDHSLSISKDQVKTLHEKGVTIICGHEHHRRRPFHNVIVIGNQFPTSVLDCKGGQEKSWLQISGKGVARIPSWNQKDNYFEVDYTQLDTVPPTAQFVRVHGDVPKGEFTKVIQLINRYRAGSSAFVVSNAVSVTVAEQLITAEQVSRVNVIQMLIDALADPFRQKVIDCNNEVAA